MESHNFPSHELHTMQHKEFMCNLLELSKGLQEIAPSAEVVAAINRTFLEWLLNHVKQEDAKLGRFLTAQPKGEKTSSFC